MAMREYFLIGKDVETIVAEENLCTHKILYKSHDPIAIINYVRNGSFRHLSPKLSVLTKDTDMLSVYSFPVWVVFNT